MSVEQDVIYLAACAVNEVVPDLAVIEKMDLEAVLALASGHMIAAAVAAALESAGCRKKEVRTIVSRAMRRSILFHEEWEAVRRLLEEKGIWYMRLKGAVLKDLYPGLGMREFADYDILIDASRAADVKEIMESRGFSTERFAVSNHDIYHKPPVLNFEMHTALFNPLHSSPEICAYYKDVEKRLRGDSCEKSFSPEDFYLYLLAHEYKHYYRSGTGLRSLLDTYVFLKKVQLDMGYVSAEAEKMGIAGFERENMSLAFHLFAEEREELTGEDREMLAYILSSGTYGTRIQKVQNVMGARGWGKLRYALSRFLVPVSRGNKEYEAYARVYPVFYKHKILLPLLPFYRTLRAVKSGRLKYEADMIRRADKKKARTLH